MFAVQSGRFHAGRIEEWPPGASRKVIRHLEGGFSPIRGLRQWCLRFEASLGAKSGNGDDYGVLAMLSRKCQHISCACAMNSEREKISAFK